MVSSIRVVFFFFRRRPVEVVEQHRSRARSVWALLLVMILAYAFYDIFTTMKQREDPAISLQLKVPYLYC